MSERVTTDDLLATLQAIDATLFDLDPEAPDTAAIRRGRSFLVAEWRRRHLRSLSTRIARQVGLPATDRQVQAKAAEVLARAEAELSPMIRLDLED